MPVSELYELPLRGVTVMEHSGYNCAASKLMKPSSEQKAEILSHIRYEIEMAFVVPRHNPEEGHIREAVFLSMLIHDGCSYHSLNPRKEDKTMFCVQILDFNRVQ